MNRQAFDVNQALPKAWELQWQRAQQNAAKGYERASHVTASDLEAQVRTFAEEQMQSKPWGSSGAAWGKPYGMRLRISGNLLDRCRDWLLDQVRKGKLESHNFGRGHISGMRFRPCGTGMSKAEQSTLHRREVRRTHAAPVHARISDKDASLLCQQPKSHRSFRSLYRGACARRPAEYAQVTCPRCRTLLDKGWCEVDYGVRMKWMGRTVLWSYRLRMEGKAPTAEQVRKAVEARHKKEGGKLLGWCVKHTALPSFATAQEAAAAVNGLWPWLKVDPGKMDWSLEDKPDEGKYGEYPFSEALQDWEQEAGVLLKHFEGRWTLRLQWRSK